MAWDDFKEMSNWDSAGAGADDFDKQQARSAAKDLWQGFKIGHEQTPWTEEEAFIECVSCALLKPIQRVGELTVEIEQWKSIAQELFDDDMIGPCEECLAGESDAWTRMESLLTKNS